MRLVYFTVGHRADYIPLLRLAVPTVPREDVDIWVLCDVSLAEEVGTIPGIRVIPCPDSPTPEAASMRKLEIFEHEIQHYSKVLFLDTDILVHGSLEPVFAGVVSPFHLYVCTETTQVASHWEKYWSLGDYTDAEFAMFREKAIHVFNAGCFAFVPSEIMKAHFDNLRRNMALHTGPFFYEQSFMNAYFNRNGWTDRTVLTPQTYVMFPKDQLYPGRIVHFTGCPGEGDKKLPRMEAYVRRMAYETQPSSPLASTDTA